MSDIGATIKVNGKDASDLFDELLEMEVEEDHRLAGMFRLKLALQRGADGLWSWLDDERIRLWHKVVIAATIQGAKAELITGYITQLKPHFDPDENECWLEIYGLDASCLMSLEEKIKDWPNRSDSDIARTILRRYQLKPVVEETGVIHNEAVATIIQRETDIQFLKRLARRNGFECFVAGDQGYFRKPVLNQSPQPVLAAHFGAETNLVAFDANLNALRPTAVEMHQLDTISKELQHVTAKTSGQRRLGRKSAAALSPPQRLTSRLFVRHAMATSPEEMKNLCRAFYDEAEWLIEARGQIDSALYGEVLRAKRLVPIKGVGEIFSGLYYVTSVRHEFAAGKYVQHFTARRNALAPGIGDFGGGAALLRGLL